MAAVAAAPGGMRVGAYSNKYTGNKRVFASNRDDRNKRSADLVNFRSYGVDGPSLDNMFNEYFEGSRSYTLDDDPLRNTTRHMYMKADLADVLTRSLGTIMLGLLVQEPSYLIRDVFPLVISDDLRWRFRTITMQPAMMTPVPHLGVSRTFEQSESESTVASKRYGINFEMEGDYANTPEGREKFAFNMQHMRNIMLHNLLYVAWVKLVRPDIKKQAVQLDRITNKMTLLAAKREQVDSFAEPYKDLLGVHNMVKKYGKIIFDRVGVRPNAMVIPSDKLPLLTSTELNLSKNLGERGVDMILGDGAITKIHDCNIYEAPTFPGMYVDQSPETPVTRRVRLGRYYVMMNRHSTVPRGEFMYEKHCIHRIYNVNNDDYDNVGGVKGWKRANENCGRWADIDPNNPNVDRGLHQVYHDAMLQTIKENPHRDDLFIVKPAPNDPSSFYVAQTLGDIWDKLDPAFTSAVRDAEKAKPITMKLFNGYIDDNTPPPWRFVCVAPFDGYTMKSVVFVAGGESAGFSVSSTPNFSMEPDARNQSFYFGATVWHGCVVLDEERILVMENAMYDGILGGGNTKLITMYEAAELRETNWQSDDINRPSVYAMAVPYDCDLNDEFLDLTGYSEMDDPNVDREHYPGSVYYGKVYGFDKLQSSYGNQSLFTPVIARDVYPTYQEVLNPMCTGFEVMQGRTHHGPYEGPQCRVVREKGNKVNPNVRAALM